MIKENKLASSKDAIAISKNLKTLPTHSFTDPIREVGARRCYRIKKYKRKREKREIKREKEREKIETSKKKKREREKMRKKKEREKRSREKNIFIDVFTNIKNVYKDVFTIIETCSKMSSPSSLRGGERSFQPWK